MTTVNQQSLQLRTDPFGQYDLDQRYYDEMFDGRTRARPGYQQLYQQLLQLPADELIRRQQAADLTFLHQGTDPAFSRVYELTFDRENRNSIRSCIGVARENARQVREQISSEMWEQINKLYLDLNRRDLRSIWNAQPHEFFREIENDICLFRGITASTMQHGEGWGFIGLGTYLERSMATATLLDVHFGGGGLENSSPQTGEYLRWIGLRRSCLAFEAYCRQYTPTVTPTNLAEFLILGGEVPRSLRFCADQLQLSLQQIDSVSETRRAERLQRLAGRLQARLRYGQIDEIVGDGIHNYLADIMRQCDQINVAIYQAYIEYAIEGEFAA